MNTGVVRRIDDLGRIVIPKEIRKSLRIKEGDSLEILIENENIILKKYSLMKNLNDFAQNITDSIKQFIDNTVLICDTDSIIAVSGNLKKQLLNKKIGNDLEIKINRREEMLEKHKKNIKISDEIECCYAVCPIIVNSDSIGLVMIIGNEIDEEDLKLTKIASKFLSNHLE